MVSTVEAAQAQRIVTGPAYVLATSSPYQFRLRSGERARVFVADPASAQLPEGEHALEQDGHLYTLSREGSVTRALVFMRLAPKGQRESQRDRWYYPVRILAIEKHPPKEP